LWNLKLFFIAFLKQKQQILNKKIQTILALLLALALRINTRGAIS